MLDWLALRRRHKRTAQNLYGSIVALARRRELYERFELPDTVEGRFDNRGGGGFNIAEIRLNFFGGGFEFADSVESLAAFGAEPGTLKRIAVIDPMKVAPPTNAPKRRTTGSGSCGKSGDAAPSYRLPCATT